MRFPAALRWLSQLYNALFTTRASGIQQEVQFWDEWFRTKGLSWPEGYTRRFDPQLELSEYHRSFIDQLPQEDIKILDVGAGPLTLLGKTHPSKRITIVATDVLADQYAQLIQKYAVRPLTPTIFADVERLTEQFAINSFDFVNAQNCIDHTQHPLEAIKQMIAVVKPACYVALRHVENEAENANYVGLHKWNFTVRDGHLMLNSKLARVDVAHELAGIATVTCFKESNWVVARICKHASPAHSSGI